MTGKNSQKTRNKGEHTFYQLDKKCLQKNLTNVFVGITLNLSIRKIDIFIESSNP